MRSIEFEGGVWSVRAESGNGGVRRNSFEEEGCKGGGGSRGEKHRL